jgi:hypothetical protein
MRVHRLLEEFEWISGAIAFFRLMGGYQQMKTPAFSSAW